MPETLTSIGAHAFDGSLPYIEHANATPLKSTMPIWVTCRLCWPSHLTSLPTHPTYHRARMLNNQTAVTIRANTCVGVRRRKVFLIAPSQCRDVGVVFGTHVLLASRVEGRTSRARAWATRRPWTDAHYSTRPSSWPVGRSVGQHVYDSYDARRLCQSRRAKVGSTMAIRWTHPIVCRQCRPSHSLIQAAASTAAHGETGLNAPTA